MGYIFIIVVLVAPLIPFILSIIEYFYYKDIPKIEVYEKAVNMVTIYYGLTLLALPFSKFGGVILGTIATVLTMFLTIFSYDGLHK